MVTTRLQGNGSKSTGNSQAVSGLLLLSTAGDGLDASLDGRSGLVVVAVGSRGGLVVVGAGLVVVALVAVVVGARARSLSGLGEGANGASLMMKAC